MKHFKLCVFSMLIMSFSAFAGQDGNGEAFQDKDVARVTCFLYAYNLKYIKSDTFTVYVKGKTHTFETADLEQKCCEKSEKLCEVIRASRND